MVWREPAGPDRERQFQKEAVMNQNRPILYIQQPCDDAVQDFMKRMNRAGLYAVRTFDLHDTRKGEADCSCPYHGTAQCDCQIVILLVYAEDDRPISLVVHGQNSQTWFSVVESPALANPHLEALLRGLLTPSELEQSSGDVSV